MPLGFVTKFCYPTLDDWNILREKGKILINTTLT